MATAAIATGLQSAGKNLIDPEKIEVEAEQSISRIIETPEIKELLASIYATDILRENTELQEEIYRGIASAISKKWEEFRDYGSRAGIDFGISQLPRLGQ